MATTTTTEPMHPAHTDGRREYLAAWGTARAVRILGYAIVTILGVTPYNTTAQTAAAVLAGMALLGLVAESRLHRRAWQWVPASAPTAPPPAPLFWIAAASGVVLPLACASVIESLTVTAAGARIACVALATVAGGTYAPFLRGGRRRDRYARFARGGAQLAAAVILSPTNAPAIVALSLAFAMLMTLPWAVRRLTKWP